MTDQNRSDHLSPRIVNNVTCMRCSCLCDDLTIEIDRGNGVRVASADSPEGKCEIAQAWFPRQGGTARPRFAIDGNSVSQTIATARAARILASASAPLVYGLTHCNTDGQRAAVGLADQLGGCIEVATSATQRASMAAFQNVGGSVSTLGVVRARADLIIFWGCDPHASHPRLWSRVVGRSGRWVPDGRAGRHVVSVGAQPLTGPAPDNHIAVKPKADADLIAALRLALKHPDKDPVGVAGVPSAQVAMLVDRMKQCRYGTIFFGDDLSADAADVFTMESLHRLVRELNAHAPFAIRYLDTRGNNAGAANVLAWQTGYPGNVDFASGYPQFRPGCASRLLERGEVDVAVLVGLENLNALSFAARKCLERIPTIVLSSPSVALLPAPAVSVAVATPGLHCGGTAYRMDDVAVPLKPLFQTELSTTEDVLSSIMNEIRLETVLELD